MNPLFEKHRDRLKKAVQTCATRDSWSPFIESPSRKLHPEGAREAGKTSFESLLGKPFDLDQPGIAGRVGKEVSPYTQMPLGIDYPQSNISALFKAAKTAMPAWRDAGVETRMGVCLEILDSLARNSFENAYATMQTAGQSFMTAFAGSGASSLDRGLEGLAYAYKAMREIPESANFERSFGHGGSPVRLRKTYRLIPRGVNVVVTCGSYPAWNAYPSMFAGLATGNPVIVKPHPNSILPMALAVRQCKRVISEAGFDPNLVCLAVDTPESPVTVELLKHSDAAIVDFTGSPKFGSWIEANCRRSLVYTETAGCNSVLIESTNDPDGMIQAIAQSLCLFSSQMCTAPQNIFIPSRGISVNGGSISFDEIVKRIVDAVDDLTRDPKQAAGLCGAIQSPAVLDSIEELTREGEKRGTIIRRSTAYEHPEFPDARTATPLIAGVDAKEKELYGQERFGPTAFIIKADNREHALNRATEDAREKGAIASYAYSSDPDFLETIRNEYNLAGASVGCNLVRHLPLNFTAAFSDFHVTGLNPAGNACLTDMAFVANRFRIVQTKTEI